ncbi:winged helix-turn-helix transcriptional regulator [Treponema lecithinolyticum]|jgi:transcriptional regulator, hxlR family
MMKKQVPECDVELTVMLISDRWKILILRDLLTGTKRFGELKKSVHGISQKVLTAHLRSMEADGLVNRKVYAQIPPRVEYSLTEKGWSLKPVLNAMARWGKTYRSSLCSL